MVKSITYCERGGEVELRDARDFDPAKIFECGQCFRWNADSEGIYTGVALGRVARVRSCGGSIYISGSLEDFETVWRGYFDLGRNYEEIRSALCIDDFMAEAIKFGAGIRILHQDKWEALCSFIISQCNNIPRIKKIIAALCLQFGDELAFEGEMFHSFPSAGTLAALTVEDIAPIRCGYRAQYVIGAAEAVASGELDLDALSRCSAEDARARLKRLRGVGDKVADCVALFGLNIPDAFPLDVWMKRAVAQHYGAGFDPRVFAPHAGIAQQYIFHYARSQGDR